jgi:sugar phosphate isomerase/epimerase
MTHYRLFVKPWKDLSLIDMAQHVRKLGFDNIELPIRAGFWCEPDLIIPQLPEVTAQLADEGVRVGNITANNALDDERMYVACAEARISMNRIMCRVMTGQNYWDAEKAARQQLDAALPLCEQYGVQITVQNHHGPFVGVNAMGLYHLLKDYDPRYIAACWDPAHNALEGEPLELGLDIIEAQLGMVNLKNAFWQRTNGPEAEHAAWRIYWTAGNQGRASWPLVAEKLKAMNYDGALCFSAEYTDELAVNHLIVADLAYARTLFG